MKGVLWISLIKNALRHHILALISSVPGLDNQQHLLKYRVVESCVIDVYAINAAVTLREKFRHFQNGLTFPRTVKHPECCPQTERRTPFNRIIGHNRKRGDISQIFFHFQFRVLLSVALFEFRQKVHNGLDSSFAVYIRQIIAFHKIAFVCALHFVGHVYVSLKHRLHFCQFRINRSTLLLFLCHYASPSFNSNYTDKRHS